MGNIIKPEEVLDFWTALGSAGWWCKNDEVDAEIREKFGALHDAASAGELDSWAETSDGALALIIVLDQFSRNLFRGSVKSFTQDAKALDIAKNAISAGLDKDAREELMVFFYLPYEHSESIADQQRSVLLQHSIRACLCRVDSVSFRARI